MSDNLFILRGLHNHLHKLVEKRKEDILFSATHKFLSGNMTEREALIVIASLAELIRLLGELETEIAVVKREEKKVLDK